MNAPGAVALAFHNRDLFDAEPINASVIQSATLCQGTCTALFVGVTLNLPTSIAGDSSFLYVSENNQVWRYDPLAATFTILADTGLLTGVLTPFSAVGAVAVDPLGKTVYAADTVAVWKIAKNASN